MSSDPIQRRLIHEVVSTQNSMAGVARQEAGQPYDIGDMYAFNFALQDVANANWANSQYTQYKYGISKAIINAIN